MLSMILFKAKVCHELELVELVSTSNKSLGLGFIMLLSGEPGVGKTLTAESGSASDLCDVLVLC